MIASNLNRNVIGAIVLIAATGIAPAMAAVNISTHFTRNMQCSAGACVPTAKNADLNTIDLAHMLATSDVTVYTGNGAVTIEVTTPLTWTGTHRLGLNAYSSVSFKAPVVSEGSGGMTIMTNVQGLGGELRFFEGGSVSFWDTNSKLFINGVSYRLVGDVPTLAAHIAAHPSGTFALANDYNAFADGIYLHAPIPTTFQGTFEGLGHAIDNLTIQNSNIGDEFVGLFAGTDTSGVIQDVRLTNLSIALNGAATSAGLVGRNRGTVVNSSATGAIQGGLDQGGLVGENDGTITTSSAAVELSNAAVASGGLAFSSPGAISFSHATGSVRAPLSAGGLASYSQGAISDSYATGSVTVTNVASAGGGLVGNNNGGSIVRSFATGSVGIDFNAAGAHNGRKAGPPRGAIALGGLAGASSGTVADCYATGIVSGQSLHEGRNSSAGGLLGTEAGSSTAATSYSIGAVNLKRGYLGGFVGYDGTLEQSNFSAYWDRDTSGISDPSRGAGNIAYDKGIHARTSQQLMEELPKGFSNAIWALNPGINNGFPYLLTNPPPP